jgi:hypothetical protein
MAQGMLNPELDLLEVLGSEDLSLRYALWVFGAENDKDALERARYVITIYIKTKLVQLLRVRNNIEYPLTDWEIRPILADDSSWTLDTRDDEFYLLRITDEGHNSFTSDSKSFYYQLFDRKKQ